METYDTTSPASSLGSREPASKSARVDVSVVGITSVSGLANHDLGEGNTGSVGDLKDGGLGPGGGGGGEETGVGGVLGCALVVELDLRDR